ncbi:MAG: hypothetical protein KKB03_02590 [Nanoarchaeota archaeon]|nr:hypothetical protein [Nanoarchaeota archaeon]MBU1135823.1 hypothetical protein [Nanoarchaeota archaeon]MBU2520106.1 hypothetical protein [Nanoarchaeota archaeon]
MTSNETVFGKGIDPHKTSLTGKYDIFRIDKETLSLIRKNNLKAEQRIELHQPDGSKSLTVMAMDEVYMNPIDNNSLVLPISFAGLSSGNSILIVSKTGRKRILPKIKTTEGLVKI